VETVDHPDGVEIDRLRKAGVAVASGHAYNRRQWDDDINIPHEGFQGCFIPTIVADEFKARFRAQMVQICGSECEVIQGNHLIPRRQKVLTQRRPEVTRSTSD